MSYQTKIARPAAEQDRPAPDLTPRWRGWLRVKGGKAWRDASVTGVSYEQCWSGLMILDVAGGCDRLVCREGENPNEACRRK